jgi:pimeloyl-ACP methyl ester carboxylesterase
MDKVAIFIHGFNVKDGGKGSTDKLKPYFIADGYKIDELDYGWRFLLGAKLNNGRFVIKLQEMCQKYHQEGFEVTVVGHSNGGCVAWLATQTDDRLATPDFLIVINPALANDLKLGPFVTKALVLYSPEDGAVGLTKLKDVPVIKWLIPAHWGDMGKVGYKGKDIRVNSLDIGKLIPVDMPVGHSTIFRDDILKLVIPKILIWFFD